MSLPHNTPLTRLICDTDSKIYSLNQNGKIVSLDKSKLMNESNISNIKFAVDKYCKHGLTEYNKKIMKLLKRNVHKKIMMTKYGNNLVFIGDNHKLLFVNTINGDVQCIELVLSNFESNVHDFGVINEEFIYICDCQRINVYKLDIKEENKIDVKLICIKRVDLQKFRSSTVKDNIVYFWLMRFRFIKVKVADNLIELGEGCLDLATKDINKTRQKIVDALVMDDKHILLYLTKGSMVLFNTVEEKVVSITNPVIPSAWVNRMINDEWFIVRGLLRPLLNNHEINELCYGYVRCEYKDSVAVALIQIMIKYYGSKPSVILFTTAMDWVKDIGKPKKLKNMVIVSAGNYKLYGQYDEMKGSKLHYK